MEPIQLSLRVPATFTLPKFYHTESPDKTSLALRLGAIAAQAAEETIREECNSDLVTQLEKKHITTRDRLEREKRGLEESLTHLQSKLSIDESLKSDLRKQIQDECRSTFRELVKIRHFKNVYRNLQIHSIARLAHRRRVVSVNFVWRI